MSTINTFRVALGGVPQTEGTPGDQYLEAVDESASAFRLWSISLDGTPRTLAGGLSADQSEFTTVLATYQALSEYSGEETFVYVAAREVAGDGAGGIFVTDGTTGHAASEGNDATIIIDADGRLWSRQYSGSLDVRWFGAKGDRVTDDQPAIQAAIDYAGATGGFEPVSIPAPPANGSNRGYYRCNAPIVMRENVEVFGESMFSTQIRFLNDTDGVTVEDVAIQSNWALRDIYLRGVADTTTSRTVTVGLNVGPSNFINISNINVERFVDDVVFDAKDRGLALGSITNLNVLSTQFPNPLNGFPRNGLTLTGTSSRPQALTFNACTVYAEIIVRSAGYTGDGAERDFTVPVAVGLFQTSGVKVYTWAGTASTEHIRAVEGVDYDLFNNTSGTPVLLTPGAVNDVSITECLVRFRAGRAPLAGHDVRLIWNDPTGQTGLNIERGTGNSFYGLAVGGYNTNINIGDSDNIIDIEYQQIANTGIDITANGNNTRLNIGEFTAQTVDQIVSFDPSVEGVVTNTGLKSQPHEVFVITDYTATTSSDAVVFNGVDAETNLRFVVPFGNHSAQVEADISYRLVEANGSRVRGTLVLEKSEDLQATWTELDRVTIDKNYGGATSITDEGRVTLSGIDDTQYSENFNIRKTVYYRVTADRQNGDSFVILGSGSNVSTLRVEPLNSRT